MRGATYTRNYHMPAIVFQLTRPMRGATTTHRSRRHRFSISTHTPHAGRDRSRSGLLIRNSHFNSHAPCGARHDPFLVFEFYQNFNSHAPCGARLRRSRVATPTSTFQLTRPMRGATLSSESERLKSRFQLTRPMRGATRMDAVPAQAAFISTHTPHAGRDATIKMAEDGVTDFNSHAPCGARLKELGIV